jgi:hypothetical protein
VRTFRVLRDCNMELSVWNRASKLTSWNKGGLRRQVRLIEIQRGDEGRQGDYGWYQALVESGDFFMAPRCIACPRRAW